MDTRSRLKGVLDNFPWIIELVFSLPYFRGESKDPETDEGIFESFCYSTYMQAPYTFWSIYDLYEKGYYLEAIVLYRHLLESFIQMRYFYKYPEKILVHIVAKSRKDRVPFSDMFNEFSDDIYKTFYGIILSGIAHGGIIKDIFRVDRTSKAEIRTILGCEYIENHATLITNITVPLLFGYINMFEEFFPNNIVKNDENISELILKAKEWLEFSMDSQKRSNPNSIDFLERLSKYIYLS